MKFQAEIPAALLKQGKRKLGQIECINENLAVLHYMGRQYPLTVTRDFTREKQHHLYEKHSRDGILEKVGHIYHRIEISNETVTLQCQGFWIRYLVPLKINKNHRGLPTPNFLLKEGP